MATAVFHLFLHLPFEVRAMIYDLTIQPRVVHIQERHECKSSFMERFRTSVLPPGYTFRENDAHFAKHFCISSWAPRYTQTILDDYGFKSKSKPPSYAGVSDEAPAITLAWLIDRPEVAWKLMRKAALFSQATLPAWLHTCNESRAYMKHCGYELSFSTWSSPGFTWFNSNLDTLLMDPMDPVCEYSRDCTCTWDISQFRPMELLKVKKLALKGAISVPFFLGPELGAFGLFIGLLEALEELHIIDWAPCDLSDQVYKEHIPDRTTLCCYGHQHDRRSEICDADFFGPVVDAEQDIDGTDVWNCQRRVGADQSSSYCGRPQCPQAYAEDKVRDSSIYARVPWKLLAYAEEDPFLARSTQSDHVRWDLISRFHYMPQWMANYVAFHEYLRTHPDDSAHAAAATRLQETLATELERVLNIFISHVVPDNLVLVRLQELRRLARQSRDDPQRRPACDVPYSCHCRQ